MHRQPAIPQWTIALIGASMGGLIGFFSSIGVSTINRWKDRRSLEDSLRTERDLIFSDLKNHLELLKKQPDLTGPSETNFSEFTKADLFQAVQGTPLYWSLKTRGQLVEAHRWFKYLVIRKPSNIRGDVINIELVLRRNAEAFPTGTTANYLKEKISHTSDSGPC